MNSMDELKTDFLVPRSTFFGGMGSVLDISGEYFDYNTSENPDEIAIAADWIMTGNDVRRALCSVTEK